MNDSLHFKKEKTHIQDGAACALITQKFRREAHCDADYVQGYSKVTHHGHEGGGHLKFLRYPSLPSPRGDQKLEST